MNEIYLNESQLRANWPMLANHLVNIASYQDGVFTAQTAGKIYQWREIR